ncbi:MAG: Glu-tRNA(Gln) amidotransferase GatDE subunit D [Nanoarchaeota archaeon]|jgi:glutamyl-tRNA(Gln) amidotransferase subunit D|nr:Glu-tRNA(Gln) amidotransferase GatDE subunit D [Nanoarchaeota archaeon]|tara:strand:+ start:15887 stop:16963 length:1077 start_codon:yes stop_codon:yes gene_type:complete
MKTISILHLGGTIASKVSKEGGVVAQFTAKDIQNLYPEIKKLAKINSRLLANMMSENMNFKHYNLIAKEIKKEINKGIDGIILTQGTDTLHYTSSALAFMLENLPIPVILVGSQRSSDRGSSDAGLNLISAINFINQTNFAEVAICMHSSMEDTSCSILPGTKSRKLSTSRRDAFKAINSTPLALIYPDKGIDFLKKNYKKVDKKRNLTLKLLDPKLKIGLLKSHPHFSLDDIKPYKHYDGLVIEGTGLGHLPIEKTDSFTQENQKIYNELKNLAKTMPIILTSQCIFGRINMNVYSPGRKLQEIGILGNLLDLTTETAFIKLAWLLSNHKKSEVPDLISENLRGEISDRTSTEFLED